MFKVLAVVLGLLLAFSITFIGGAEQMSAKIETYAQTKFTEPKIEEYAFYNMEYTYWVAKYDLTLKQIEKFEEKYPYSTRLSEVIYLKARTYDRKLVNRTAMDLYSKYLQDYPDGKRAKDSKQRLDELKTGF